ncbi:MAG: SBBP repeat-containing protein [Bacteroidetes bacterium]|nr:SBBP repeat-containing protein [Bacteroidota bacterium]
MKKLLLGLFCWITFLLAQAGEPNARDYLHSAPVRFLENNGQMTDMDGKLIPFVLFKAEAPGVNLYLTEKGLTYCFVETTTNQKLINHKEVSLLDKMHDKKNDSTTFHWNRIDMILKDASIQKENIIAEGKSHEFFQYFLGHCPDGIKDVHEYEKITVKNIYPGIDWVLYNSDKGGFEYDFIVHPGGNPKQIELIYSSLNPLSISREGNINIQSELGILNENAPLSFQNGKEIKTEFSLIKTEKSQLGGFNTHVQFSLSNYNKKQDLRIDPKLVWSTFYGGNTYDDDPSTTIDKFGNLFIKAWTNSIDFPTYNSGSYYLGSKAGSYDFTILKFSNSGVRLWATYYGGEYDDIAHDLACDIFGNLFIVGETISSNFPVQNAGTFFQGTLSPNGGDAFILKFDNNGNRLWATFYGGGIMNSDPQAYDGATAIACDHKGNIFIFGNATSLDFPTLNSGTYFQGTYAGGIYADIFVLKFDNIGNRLWATYAGGKNGDDAVDINVDINDNVIIAGHTRSIDFPLKDNGTFFQGSYAGVIDLFIMKFNNNGNILWSTYYGGSMDDVWPYIETDNAGNIFITGSTNSTDLPLLDAGTFFQTTSNTGGIYESDVYILKFDSVGNRTWATYFGGNDVDQFPRLALDSCQNLYITFQSSTSNIPTFPLCTATGFNANKLTGYSDIVIARFNTSNDLQWSSYFGGNNVDHFATITIDTSNNLFIVGDIVIVNSNSTFPIADIGSGAYIQKTPKGKADLFITKFSPDQISLTPSQVNPSICLCNGSATITVDCSLPPYTFKWSNGITVIDTNTSVSTINNLCPGSYSVEVSSHCYGKTIANFTITSPTGALTVNNLVNNSTCEKSNGSAHISVSGGTKPYSFSWLPNISTDSLASNLSAGTYVVTVNDSSCIPVIQKDTIEILSTIQPNADFSFSQDLSCEGISSTFKNSSTKATSYFWNFGDGANSNEQIPVHYFAANKNYPVTLIAQNSLCYDTLTKNISVDAGSILNINSTNVFTPNNDGYNDCFNLSLIGTNSLLLEECIQLQIYDRWGIKVFESTDSKKCWNGLKNNENAICPSGTYFYIAKFQKSTISGYISLIR